MEKSKWRTIFDKLRRAKPQQAPDFAVKLGQAREFLQRGHLAQAMPLYRDIIKQAPNHFEALHLLGMIEFQSGRHEDGIQLLGRALKINPQSAEAQSDFGMALMDLQQPEEALLSFDRALAIKPDLVAALNNRGHALLALKRPKDAIWSFDAALAINPDFLPALNNRGSALLALKRPSDALVNYDRALAFKPDFKDALIGRGNALMVLKRPEDALESLDQALAITPDFPGALNNRGNALVALRRYEDALVSFDRALAVMPNYADALSNAGNAQMALSRYEDALASFDRALAIKPDYAEVHWNEGLCRLLTGDFERGWKKYEWRWQVDELETPKRELQEPLWLGEQAITGKTILLHAEQGLGDTLQFCRYAKIASDQGAKVLLEVQPALKALLAGLKGVSEVFASGEQLPCFDIHCPLLSLPLAFKTTLNNIPAKIPYLHSDGDRVGRWLTKLGNKTVPRIGLVWSGNMADKDDQNRSIPLCEFEKLMSGKAQFISLQKEVTAADRNILGQHDKVLHFGDELNDFADTAALVDLMDVIISVDTSVAHLAGAMGKPVWILLPFNPDWRWLLDREDSPWYPTARLFRQPVIGDWVSVLSRVERDLIEFLECSLLPICRALNANHVNAYTPDSRQDLTRE